jgi:hypothetical protein
MPCRDRIDSISRIAAGRNSTKLCSWAAVEAGRSWSSPVVVLQSSELGYGVYAAMGFRTVGRFAEFAPRG